MPTRSFLVRNIRSVRPVTWRVGFACLALAAFLAETVLGIFSHGVLFSSAIILASFSLDQRFIGRATAICVVLSMVGYAVTFDYADRAHAAVDSVLAAAVLLATGGLAAFAAANFRHLLEARDAALAAAEELRRVERLLAVAGRSAKLGGWSYDVSSGKLDWSDQVYEIHGVPLHRNVGIDEAIAFYTPDSRERVRRRFKACSRDGAAYDELLEFVAATGEQKWVRAIGEPVRDSSGAIVQVQGAFQDVSEQRLLQEDLSRSRRQFRQLADAMPLVVFTAEADGRIDYANRVYFDLTSEDAADLAQSAWLNAIHPDDRDAASHRWADSVAAGREHNIQFRIRGRDGLYRWHQVLAKPIRDESGQIASWYGTATDIDDQKRNEEKLQRISDQLVATIESITAGFFTIDPELRFTYVNGEFARWVGLAPEQLLGKKILDVFPLLAGTSLQVEFGTALAENRAVRFEQHFPQMDKWLELHAYPSGEGLSVYLQDVSTRREMDQRLRQSQRLEAVGQLTGGIAHDFNNLLTVIVSNSEALAEAVAGDENLLSLAQMSLDAAERGAKLTSRLLSFARQQPLAPEPTDIGKLVAGIHDLLRRTLGEQIELQVSGKGAAWDALVDPSQLENALLNLSINARDAMPNGGKLTIATSNAQLDADPGRPGEDIVPGHFVTISVTDSGTGMTPDVVAQAFEPFFTTKPVGQGSGLGLSMVYGFVKQSGGQIAIASTPGEGTTVTLYLPKAAEKVKLGRRRASDPFLPFGHERVLVVEDSPGVRENVRQQLTRLGYTVESAADGPEAVEILRSDSDFDLLFTDVVMPNGMSGFDLAVEARKLHPGLPVLFMSGYAEASVFRGDEAADTIQLLSKPYRLRDLALKLREVLDDEAVDPDTRQIRGNARLSA